MSNLLSAQEFDDDATKPAQSRWMEAMQNAKSLDAFYIDSSGLLLNDELTIGAAAVQAKLKQAFPNGFSEYVEKEAHQLRHNRRFVYGSYTAADGKEYKSIIGWHKRSGWMKEFEVIYPEGSTSSDAKNQANALRALWVELANQHDPAKIGTDVFSQKGKYFNRGMSFSSDQIGQAYSYMSNESFSISLETHLIAPINENITYEIGTFDSGGRGLYVLIWVKEATGWKLLLDFNF